MLKIFRNIRRNILFGGNTSRYLKYAVGEIVLVVIGILIAVNINNWNEERKNKITRETLLLELGKGTKWKLTDFAQRIYLRDSLVGLYLSDKTPEEFYDNPQALYALFDPGQRFMEILSSLMADENVNLILDKKKEYPDDYEALLAQLKVYKSSLDNYTLSYHDVKSQFNEIEKYLQEKNPAIFKFDSTDFATMKRIFLHDEIFKTKLRVYRVKYRNFISDFSGMRATYTIVLAEIDRLLGEKRPKLVFQKEGYYLINAISCDSVKPNAGFKPGDFENPLVPIIPIRNEKNDSIFLGALNPLGTATNKTPLPGRSTLSFNLPEGIKFKLFNKKGDCLYNGISKRNGFVVIE